MIINKTVFEKIIAPAIPFFEKVQNSIPNDASNYTLSFLPFSINILFALISRIPSISLLVTDIKTSSEAKSLGLAVASKSMYSEAFSRYNSDLFRSVFVNLLSVLSFLGIPEIEHLGQIMLIDGSLFPAISTMSWASYKSTANAIKMHLSFSLNKMIPVEFLAKEGKYSERKFLKDILEKGITYICDRGYISFKIFKNICDKEAFFIIRGKQIMLYNILEELNINIPCKFVKFFTKIEDIKIKFLNDKDEYAYRIVKFTAMGELYVLITNRFDLTTYEVIMLYAYRWQIELCFRFLKRTMTALHLMSHSPEGINIQFYLYMIAYLLILFFKQECHKISDEQETNEESEAIEKTEKAANKTNVRPYVRGLVTLLGENLQKYWKIGLHWLRALKNSLLKLFEHNIAIELSRYG